MDSETQENCEVFQELLDPYDMHVHDGTENEELFEEHESLDSTNSNKCDNSAEDFRGFCDQKKCHSALHCC
jgi:hypothetical protein